jgi:23S rRNA (cytidine2498-2'-O)-methyltransferase
MPIDCRIKKGNSVSSFVFVVCQCQTENMIKRWMLHHVPQAKFAFSRPGLLTFKLEHEQMAAAQALPLCPFIRSFGWSWETVTGGPEEVSAGLAVHQQRVQAQHLHVWARDPRRVGDRGFEPFGNPEWIDWGTRVTAGWSSDLPPLKVNQVAEVGDKILDLIQVESDRWLLGWHNAASVPSTWVGGVPPLQGQAVISRAYYKLREAHAWSKLPLREGELALELGAAPGGACQYLLELGLKVVGVDPAEMSPDILAHPNFEHWRMRGAEIQKKRLKRLDWLVCDSNVAPQHTLDSVEGIATNQHVQCRGLVLTLKMPDWKLVDQLPAYIARVKSWGYPSVETRHLAFNRQELCVVAVRPS